MPTIAEIAKFAEKAIAEEQQKKEKALSDKVKQVKVVDVVHEGDKILLPENVSKPEAIEIIHRSIIYENEMIQVVEQIDAFVWDGAVAFKKAMDQMFGVVFAKPDFFRPPTEINIETDAIGGKVSVPWGVFTFPGATKPEEQLSTGTNWVDGRQVFQIQASVTRAHKEMVSKLADLTRYYVRTQSIYRGKAFRLNYRDAEGDFNENITPKFLDLSKTDPRSLVFRDEIMRAIDTNIWTPLKYREASKAAGVPFKRGVLLAGPYGTGKTLAAHSTAIHATQNGITFIYLEDSRDLAEAIRFAKRYSPAVIFAEDIDRATSGEERTVEIDNILNTLDGVDSKDAEIMVVLTTNHLEEINSAMLRPGRLDVVLNIMPPDSAAVRKLIRIYGGNLIAFDASLDVVGMMLDGQIPAIVREVVERSKLEAIRRTNGEGFSEITDEDLEQAAFTVKQQQALFLPKVKESRPSINEAVFQTVAEALQSGVEVSLAPQNEEMLRAARNRATTAAQNAGEAATHGSVLRTALKDVPEQVEDTQERVKKIERAVT